MRALSLLLAALLLSASAMAQAPLFAREPAAPDTVATQPARPATRPDLVAPALDTVAALHRLFDSRRKDVTRIVITSLGIGVAQGALVLGSLSSQGVNSQLIAPIFIIPVGITAALGIPAYFFQYNHRHEQRALAKLQAHKLPNWIKRELKPPFFQ